MHWVASETGQTYALTRGRCHCRIWHATVGPWGAMVNHNDGVELVTNFGTVEAASAWCERWVNHLEQGIEEEAAAIAEVLPR